MTRDKRVPSRFPNRPPSKSLPAGTYAVYDGVEVRLDRKGQGWQLVTEQKTAGFTRDEYGRYVRPIAMGDPLELECFRLKYHGTYRGIAFEVQSPEGPVMAWTRDSRSLAEGFNQVDRGEYRKTIPLDDPDLHITTTRTPLPVPWAAKRSDEGTSAWNGFRDRLADTFRKTSDRFILIIASDADSRRYVQFAGEGDRLYAEAPGKDVAFNADESVLSDTGWQPPGVAQPNWSSVLPLPALTSEYRELAERCVAALRNSYGVKSPDDLSYRAWREAEQIPVGQTWSAERVARMDPGSSSVDLPGLMLDSNHRDGKGTPGMRTKHMTWKSMPPAEVCDIMDFWIAAPWPLSEDEAQQRAVERFGWTIDVEDGTPYLMNTVSNFNTPDVMTIAHKDVMMDLTLDASDAIREVTPESTAFLGDAFTLMVREGEARWGKPKLEYFEEIAAARWNADSGAIVTFRFLPKGVTARFDTPEGAELERRAGGR